MNRDQARQLVKNTFKQKFDKGRFTTFIGNLLNHIDVSNATSCNFRRIKDAYKPHVDLSQRIGTYTSPDNQLLDVLVVRLTSQAKLIRTRAAIRNFVADYLAGEGKHAALVAFVSPSENAWRFSYVKMEYATVEKSSGDVGVEARLTPARRFSYLVGPGESCHTAQTRFLDLLQNTQTNPQLEDIEEAFSVEAVTKEFFAGYKDLALEVKEELDRLAAGDNAIRDEFAACQISTIGFAKKLMGQIVFLYFLQKKGWLGVAKDAPWGTGPHNFLRKLADGDFGQRANFFDDMLEPLFYGTLAKDRGHEAFCERFDCRIPFLNGGLFEPLNNYNWRKTEILLPNRLFTNDVAVEEGITGTGILDVFDRYNFTVNEAEPLEKEVAIDPEMLGKVFENLLEVKERKSKGSFYTPREIVHYMCQESLINYLDTAVNGECDTGIPACTPSKTPSQAQETQTGMSVLPQPQTQTGMSVPRCDIETFIHEGDRIADYDAVKANHGIELPAAIKTHARLLDDKLAAITVCDPAIGSGAFPVGMMQEIVRARSALTPYCNDVHDRTAYHFKRHAIQNCLYGVDIDPGAVEIAKLRLWLSLVVDEEDVRQIKPLPNLDYRVVVGNSLLGFLFRSVRVQKIEELKARFFGETDYDAKMRLKTEIDGQLSQAFANSKRSLGYEVNFDFQTVFSEVFRGGGFDVVIGNPPYVSHEHIREMKTALREASEVYSPFADIYCYFIEKAVRVLAKKGVLAFITSNSYIKADYGAKLREYLGKHTNILQLLSVERSQIFDTAIVNVAILLATKAQPVEGATAYVINSAWNSASFRRFVRAAGFEVPRSVFNSCTWALAHANVQELRARVEANGKALISLGAKIRLGIATGRNDAFLLTAAARDALLDMDGRNGDVIVPVVRGRDIERYGKIEPGTYLIAARNGVNIKRDYPTLYRHFESFGASFRSRGAQGQEWWNLRACSFYDDFDCERIVWIELSNEARFTRCPAGVWCLNSAYFMLPPLGFSLSYILGVLNSRLIKFYFNLIAQTSGMGVTRWINVYVEKFPIPTAPSEEQGAVERLVDRILAAKEEMVSPDTSSLEREIDQLVYQLYNLTPEEIAIVEGAG